MFLEDCPGRMAAIKAAVEQGDANALCTAAPYVEGIGWLPGGRVCRRRGGAARAPRARRPPRGRSGRGGSTGGRGGPARAGNPARRRSHHENRSIDGRRGSGPDRVRQARPPERRRASGRCACTSSIAACSSEANRRPTASRARRSVQTDFSDACYLVVHPQGTLLWDVGIIPDDADQTRRCRNFRPRNGTEQRLEDAQEPAGGASAYRRGHHVPRGVSRACGSRRPTRMTMPARRGSFRRPSGTSCSAQRRRSCHCSPTTARLRTARPCSLDGDHDVFGDGTVMLNSTPGHTPGLSQCSSNWRRPARSFSLATCITTPPNGRSRRFRSTTTKSRRRPRGQDRSAPAEAGTQLWIQHDIDERQAETGAAVPTID